MTPPRRLLVSLTAAAIALPLAAGCGSDAPSGPPKQPKPATIEQLAAKLGCAPQEKGRLKDYRQATCSAKTGNYLLNTFDTAEGQDGWMDTATLYGGVYLVGSRWVVQGPSPQALDPLRQQFGGRIKDARPKRKR